MIDQLHSPRKIIPRFLEFVFIAHNSTVLNLYNTQKEIFTCLSRMKSNLDKNILWTNTVVKVKNDSHAPLLHIGSLRPESDLISTILLNCEWSLVTEVLISDS